MCGLQRDVVMRVSSCSGRTFVFGKYKFSESVIIIFLGHKRSCACGGCLCLCVASTG